MIEGVRISLHNMCNVILSMLLLWCQIAPNNISRTILMEKKMIMVMLIQPLWNKARTNIPLACLI